MNKFYKNFGCYVSSAGGLHKILDHAKFLDIEVLMTHPSPPQRWNSKPFEEQIIKQFYESKNYNKDIKVFFHGIYLINLASPDNQKYHLSKLSILNHLELLLKIKGLGVVFHPGSFKEISEKDGFIRIANGINWIFENLKITPTKNCLLIECSAGAGRIVGSKFEDLANIYNLIKEEYKEYVGFCLDTQHMFASGYDIVNNPEEVVFEANKILDISKINLIHLNDSKTQFGSNRDRHEDIGKGLIGKNGIKNIVNNKLLKSKYFVMETPSLESLDGARSELDTLFTLIE